SYYSVYQTVLFDDFAQGPIMDNSFRHLPEQLTHQIITSPDLEQSLFKTYTVLKKWFHVAYMHLHIYDQFAGILTFKAVVTDEGVLFLDERLRLSSQGRKSAETMVETPVKFWKASTKDPVVVEVRKYFEYERVGPSLRVMTRIDDHRYGGIGIESFYQDAYGPKEYELMENLFEVISGAIRHIIPRMDIERQNSKLTTELEVLRKKLIPQIIGEHSGLKEVMSQVDQVAGLGSPVLLTGETGVGKEVIANAIHFRSARKDSPLICFNCGAIPDTLVESELFGHEKGAFTGADKLKHGFFEQANHGTVFMDEVGELSLKAQVKLLRFLQTKELRRVGGTHQLALDVRIVTATNRDLEAMVAKGTFREDLWYRLNVYPIHIPPLRDRVQDIPDLALVFARIKSREMNLPFDFNFAPEAMDQLQSYHWPGNVREIQNVIERALIIGQGAPLCFPELIKSKLSENENHVRREQEFPTLDELISHHIRKSLALAKGKVDGPGGAAELLGLNPSTLRGKMRKYQIKVSRSAI
ncbi:MAG: sigma 54-interacting transcriptional regulator, partial [Desulfobacterales bacterium]|nr:sigma 54-interacting transcriptional regulator [Desulfobacterales bacterium]